MRLTNLILFSNNENWRCSWEMSTKVFSLRTSAGRHRKHNSFIFNKNEEYVQFHSWNLSTRRTVDMLHCWRPEYEQKKIDHKFILSWAFQRKLVLFLTIRFGFNDLKFNRRTFFHSFAAHCEWNELHFRKKIQTTNGCGREASIVRCALSVLFVAYSVSD